MNSQRKQQCGKSGRPRSARRRTRSPSVPRLEPIAVGKVPPSLLQSLLELPRKHCAELIVPPALGEDAAVLRLGSRLVAVGTDPVTFPTPRPGFFAVHVNANDIAVMGAVPKYFTMTVLMPPGTTPAHVTALMADALAAANSVGVVLLGGHTEVTEAVRLPVVSVTMFGELLAEAPLRTANGRPGDAVIQVNPFGIEGTAILASEHRKRLTKCMGAEAVRRMEQFVFDPGLSVVQPAVLAASRLDVHAMHDPTEGGIATGLCEIAQASGTGLLIREREMLALPETRQVCELVGVDPLGVISSGCLLFTVGTTRADAAVALLQNAGFAAASIGALTPEPGVFLLENARGKRRDLPRFAVDELATGVV